MRDLVHRPPAEDRKIHSKDEFELCYLRHQYLRRVDWNPTEADMKPYMRIVEYMARNTYYTYRYLFTTVGMEHDCIVNIGRVFLTEFLGLFEFGEENRTEEYAKFVVLFSRAKKTLGKYPNQFDVTSKNKANLTLFLKQRNEDLVRICKQKAKNIRGLRIDDYVPFMGPNPPPVELWLLLEDNEAYNFKRIDNVRFRAVKKRAKADIKLPFEYSGSWYVAVTLDRRSLSIHDLQGAGLDPHEAEHNKNPEQLLAAKQEERRLDKKRKMFKNYTKEEKAKVIFGFIEKNEDNPTFQEEINIAKRFLREMGIEHVR